ncbi:MAG TPA: response regulator [Candidatus Binatia bacterium]|nr:response regulator [Candidatus Binatia bacterium]
MTHVLVIDDESTIRWSIEQTLRAAGYTVALAENGTEGMRLFRELDPAVVLLDVRLPDEDGFTLLDRMVESRRGTAVIVMTAFDDMRTPADAMRLGATAYLKKPFDFDALAAEVCKALEAYPVVGGGDANRS